MSEAPERHPDVPAGAIWLEDVEKWEHGSRDPGGIKQGEFRLFRPDGSLYMRCRYDAGISQGPFTLFHPNGQVAREGTYSDGEIHGAVNAFASDAPTSESLRGCCVPTGAWEMRAKYERGQLLGERFFDREGRALLSDGTLRPEPPPGLPADVEFDEFSRRWSTGPRDGSGSGLWRYYAMSGALDEEVEYDQGRRRRFRLYDQRGEIRQETSLDTDGTLHGPHRRRYVDGDESPYLDARIVEERGSWEQGQPVGRWEFRDGAGEAVRVVERGRPVRTEDDLVDPVFRDGGTGWAARAEALVAEGLTRQAIVAASRAAAEAGEADGLVAFLAKHTVALTAAPAEALSREATDGNDAGAPAMLSALVGGGEPAALLRGLAATLKGAPRAAHDLVQAAMLLAPDRPMLHLTRALVRLELGDERGALADAARLEAESPETAGFVRDYARLLFPEWTFWPGRERLVPTEQMEGMPDAPGQPLEKIREVLAVYATRLQHLREAARRWVSDEPAWLPPSREELLPEGRRTLRRWTGSITDETDDGPETIEVEIDETLDTTDAGLPALMRSARAQWAAVTWLCWSTGLDRVALPREVSPPETFGPAVATAITRFFRAQDVLVTNGLRSLSAGVPGFTWEGMEIDGMPKHFVQMTVDEYFELRALFLWLASPENLSPFQNDLRQV